MGHKSDQKNFPLYKMAYENGVKIIAEASMPDFGITAGDILEFSFAHRLDEDRLSIWNIKNTKNVVIGFAYENFDDISIITSAENIRSFKIGDILQIGWVRGVLKKIPTLDEFLSQNGVSKTSSDEGTVICKNCQAQLTGSTAFIKGMGWQLKTDDVLCVSCW